MLKKLELIRTGRELNSGFFLNEHWLPLSPHSAKDAVAARKALCDAFGIDEIETNEKKHGKSIDKTEWKSCEVNNLALNECGIEDLSTFCSNFGKVQFFDGSIKSLSVGTHVDEFHYCGYDVQKLVEIANQHPELFKDAQFSSAKEQGKKVQTTDITFRRLTLSDLVSGKHPCMIGGRVDPCNAPYKEAAEKHGTWGYVAEHSSRVCGYLRVLPKSVAKKDAYWFIPPCGKEEKETLLLTCFAGGGIFGEEYSGIGIATKLVETAIDEAREKGYSCVEANPHNPGIGHILEKCGFTRFDWSGGGSNTLRDKAYYRKILVHQVSQ